LNDDASTEDVTYRAMRGGGGVITNM